MLKKLITLVLFILTVCFIGCSNSVYTLPPVNIPVTTQEPIQTVTPEPITLPEVTPEKSIYDTTYVYPSSVDVEYVNGMVMDKWLSNDPDIVVGHKKGEPLAIVIHNGDADQLAFNLSVISPDNTINYSARHGKYYTSASSQFLNYVTLGTDNVILAPDSVAKIPVTISIPEDANITGSFEFRILVANSKITDAGGGTGIGTASGIRFFMDAKS